MTTPEEARTALDLADRQERVVRGGDKVFRAVLLGVAAAYAAVGVLVGLLPPRGSLLAPIGVGLVLVVTLTVVVVGIWRARAFSRRGLRRFLLLLAAWAWWNALIVGLSSGGGWWGPNQPRYHFTLSTVVSALPLLLGAWLLGRR